MQIEITATAADEAPIQPLRDSLRFRLEFALLMISAGRIEEAAAAFETLAELIETRRVSHVLLAMPSASRVRRNQILTDMSQHRVVVRTLPTMADLAEGRVTVSDIRDLDIDDLLGRDAVAPNYLLLAKKVTGRTVLVTGAGG